MFEQDAVDVDPGVRNQHSQFGYHSPWSTARRSSSAFSLAGVENLRRDGIGHLGQQLVALGYALTGGGKAAQQDLDVHLVIGCS